MKFSKFFQKSPSIEFPVDGKPPKKDAVDSIWSEDSKQAKLIFNLREKAFEASKKAGMSGCFHGPVKLELTVYAPNILERKDRNDYAGDLDAFIGGVFDSLQPAPKNSTLKLHPMFNDRKDIGAAVSLIVADDAQIVTTVAKKRKNQQTFYTVLIEAEDDCV